MCNTNYAMTIKWQLIIASHTILMKELLGTLKAYKFSAILRELRKIYSNFYDLIINAHTMIIANLELKYRYLNNWQRLLVVTNFLIFKKSNFRTETKFMVNFPHNF